MTTKELQALGGVVHSAKTELVLIGNKAWRKGPDGLWYRLDEGNDNGSEEG